METTIFFGMQSSTILRKKRNKARVVLALWSRLRHDTTSHSQQQRSITMSNLDHGALSQQRVKMRLKKAHQVLKSELDSYDLLSRPAKQRRVESRYQETERRRRVDLVGPQAGYQCGHAISLTLPCPHCCRSIEDCVEYIVALRSRLKELLSQLS